MESIIYEKCSFKYEVKAGLVSIFLASSGNSLYILPAAKAKDFWPNFNFRSGSAKMLLLFLVNFSCFDLQKYPLNGSQIFSCMQLKTNLHTLFFI